ncbi:MAG: hypothetical protein KGH71_05580, partial [Candidatus Micrarchaeota archaeon]|nr:hypothetical protein [Candidatus Micrarchaeota archaeon]
SMGQAGKRAQSAMEYLLTYGWAFLIIGVVLGAMFALGIFNPGQFASPECLLPAGFSCLSFFLSTNGQLQVNLEQATQTPLNITGYNCTQNSTVKMIPIPPANQIYLPIGSNYTFTMNCFTTGNILAAMSPGQFYTGTLAFNYTEITTGFPHVAFGKLAVKVT